jgi:hypothetical protein
MADEMTGYGDRSILGDTRQLTSSRGSKTSREPIGRA